MTPANDMTKFWSDDFDMDLLKLFPDIAKDMGPVAHAKLWVLGSLSTDNVFSHPTVWNGYDGMESLFWAEQPPDLLRDEHGWLTMEGGLTTNSPMCCITVMEAIRDCWVHDYNIHLEGRVVLKHGMRFYNSHFYPIMATVRGWKVVDIERRLREVKAWALQGARNMQVVIEAKRLALGRECPYFAEAR